VKLMLLKDVMEQNDVLKQISLANTNLNLEGFNKFLILRFGNARKKFNEMEKYSRSGCIVQ
jgi:hypothetical protein